MVFPSNTEGDKSDTSMMNGIHGKKNIPLYFLAPGQGINAIVRHKNTSHHVSQTTNEKICVETSNTSMVDGSQKKTIPMYYLSPGQGIKATVKLTKGNGSPTPTFGGGFDGVESKQVDHISSGEVATPTCVSEQISTKSDKKKMYKGKYSTSTTTNRFCVKGGKKMHYVRPGQMITATVRPTTHQVAKSSSQTNDGNKYYSINQVNIKRKTPIYYLKRGQGITATIKPKTASYQLPNQTSPANDSSPSMEEHSPIGITKEKKEELAMKRMMLNSKWMEKIGQYNDITNMPKGESKVNPTN